jgi:ribosomal protein L40E
MMAKDKVKMCPFCEGNVPYDAEDCRYCGSSFVKGSQKARTPYQTEDSLAGLYEPPYSPDRSSSRFGISSPEDRNEEEEVAVKPEKKKKERTTSPTNDAEEGNKLGSILLLSIGGWLFTLSWLLFFLSDQGAITLQWKSNYWPVYLVVSTLFLYQGWKKLSASQNQSSA